MNDFANPSHTDYITVVRRAEAARARALRAAIRRMLGLKGSTT